MGLYSAYRRWFSEKMNPSALWFYKKKKKYIKYLCIRIMRTSVSLNVNLVHDEKQRSKLSIFFFERKFFAAQEPAI